MNILLTWDKCLPIRTDDVFSGDIITTQTGFGRFVMADHDYFIHYHSACCKTRTYYIWNFVTRRFWVLIGFYAV